MEATKPLRCTWRWPIIESVIWPIIKFLKDPETEMKARTKTTPTVISEAVSSVRRLYRSRLRIAILKRLTMAVPSLVLDSFDFAVLECEKDFRLTDDFLVVGREDKGCLEFVAHPLH